jgi:anti-sigma factor RsiW
MHCQQATEWMSLKLDNLLDGEEQSALEAHLAACSDCQQNWAAMQRVSAMLTNAPQVLPAPDFTARVMGKIAERRSRQQLIAGYTVLTLGLLLLLALPLSYLLGPLYWARESGTLSTIWSEAPSFTVRMASIATSFVDACALLLRAILTVTPKFILVAVALTGSMLTILWIRLISGPQNSVLGVRVRS